MTPPARIFLPIHPSLRPNKPMPSVFLRVLLMLACLCSLSLLAVCVPAVFTQRDLSHPESIVPWAVREIAHGQPLYTDWRQWPHRFMPYGPLLTWPAGMAFRLLGSGDYSFHYYLVGRIQALLYMLGTIGIAAAMMPCRRYWAAAAVAMASIGLWPGLAIPGVSFRGDWPALFWCLAAALVAYRHPQNPRRLLLAAALFLLSVAYRPALWSFPAAFALFLLFHRQFKMTFIWCAAVALSVGAYMLAGQLLTNNMFLLNQVGASSMGFTTEVYRLIYQILKTEQDFPLITWDLILRLVLGIPVALFLLIKSNKPFEQGIAIYFLVSLILNLASMLKAGSSYNYIIEAYILSTVILTTGAVRLLENANHPSRTRTILVTGTATVLFLAPMGYFSYINFKTVPQILSERKPSAAQQYLLQLPPTALLGDLAFTHPAPAAHALSDPLPYARLARKDKISQHPLLSHIANRHYSHIVLSPGTKYLYFSSKEIPWAGEALQKTYHPATINNNYEVWVPKTSLE